MLRLGGHWKSQGMSVLKFFRKFFLAWEGNRQDRGKIAFPNFLPTGFKKLFLEKYSVEGADDENSNTRQNIRY